MRFENGQTATLEIGGVPGAVYGPEPWSHRVLGTEGELRVVPPRSRENIEPDVLLYSSDHPDGKRFEHPVYEEHHGLLLADFARTVLRGPGATRGVSAEDSLGESLTAMAIYRANESGGWESVFVKEAVGDEVEALAARL